MSARGKARRKAQSKPRPRAQRPAGPKTPPPPRAAQPKAPTPPPADVELAGFNPLARPTGWQNSRTFIYLEMLIFAALSLLAAGLISIDMFHLAGNADLRLPCDINSVISCGTVARSWQAQVFGFPNAFFGMVAEPVVITICVATLARVTFPRWFLFTANAVYLLAVIFAYWLLFQSMFVIHALCPWCLVITFATTLVFTSMLHWNILENNLFLKPGTQAKALSFVRSGAYHVCVGIVIVALLALLLSKYGYAIFGG